MEPQIGYCTNTDGISIAYATIGQGPAILIENEFSISIKELTVPPNAWMGFLGDQTRQSTLVFYDHSGTGLSGRNRTDFTLDSFIRDIETVVDHLKLGRMILYTQGAGGPIALSYAAAHPEQLTHLILFNTYSHLEHMGEAAKGAMATLLRNQYEVGMRGILSLAFQDESAYLTDLGVKAVRENVTPETYASYWEKLVEFDARPLLPKIKVPTLVMRRRDHYIPVSATLEMASLLPEARLVMLDGKGHWPWIGGYKSFERAVAEFMGKPVTIQPDDEEEPVPQEGKSRPGQEQQHEERRLRMDNPLVFIIITLVTSVVAGIILMFVKC